MSVAFRFRGSLDDEGADTDALFERGCRGVQQDGEWLLAFFPERVELPLQGSWEEVEEVDHLGRYLEGLEPVPVGRLVVAPSHREVTLRAGGRVLWLDPGMAFGTGHHETTRMALAALERRDLTGRRVLDVGAGSGILAIAADLLGAAEAVGVDVDPDTVPVARENARLNLSRARFELGSVADAPGGPADVLVANLYAELHARLADAYRAALRPGAELLLTGILRDRAELVRAALGGGFEPLGEETDGEWVLLAYRRAEGR